MRRAPLEAIGLMTIGIIVTAVAILPGLPEPAAWSLVLAGFGLVGAVLRRRTLTIEGET